MRSRLLSILLVGVVIAALAAAPASADNAAPSVTHHTTTSAKRSCPSCPDFTSPADFKAWVENPNHNIGPSRYTGQGIMQITGFKAGVHNNKCDCTVHAPKTDVYLSGGGTRSSVANRADIRRSGQKRDCWLVFCNPFDWDWKDMFTVAHNWDNAWDFLNKCADGVHDELPGYASSNVALYMLGEGDAVIEFTPQGLVIVVVGGCTVGVLH